MAGLRLSWWWTALLLAHGVWLCACASPIETTFAKRGFAYPFDTDRCVRGRVEVNLSTFDPRVQPDPRVQRIEEAAVSFFGSTAQAFVQQLCPTAEAHRIGEMFIYVDNHRPDHVTVEYVAVPMACYYPDEPEPCSGGHCGWKLSRKASGFWVRSDALLVEKQGGTWRQAGWRSDVQVPVSQ